MRQALICASVLESKYGVQICVVVELIFKTVTELVQKSVEYVFDIKPGEIGYHTDEKMKHLFHLENLRPSLITDPHAPWRPDNDEYAEEFARFKKITKVIFFIDLEWLIPFLRNTYYLMEHKKHFDAIIFKLLGVMARRSSERSNKNEEVIIPSSLFCNEELREHANDVGDDEDENNAPHRNGSNWLRQKSDTIPSDDSMIPVYACNDMVFWTLWRTERRHLFRHHLYRPFHIMTAEYLTATRILRNKRGQLMKPFARLVTSWVTRLHPLYPYKQDNKDKHCYFRMPSSIRMWKMEENAHFHRQKISYLKREVEINDMILREYKERKEMLEKQVKEAELNLSNSIVENEHSEVVSCLTDQCRALPLNMAPLDLWQYDPMKHRRFSVEDFAYEKSVNTKKKPEKIESERKERIGNWLSKTRNVTFVIRNIHAVHSISSETDEEEEPQVEDFMTPPGDDHPCNETLEDHDNAYRDCVAGDDEEGASEDYDDIPRAKRQKTPSSSDDDGANDIGGVNDFMQVDND